MPAKTTKCYAKDPSKCRYHGKPDGLRPPKNMSVLAKNRLAADFNAAQQRKAATATGTDRARLLENIKAEAIVDALAAEGFFNDSEFADDDAAAAKKWALSTNQGDEYVDRKNMVRLVLLRGHMQGIRAAFFSYDRTIDDSTKWHITEANYRLNARLQNPPAATKDLPQRPITLYDRQRAVAIVSDTIRDILGGDQAQSDAVANSVYDHTFLADKPSEKGAFWETQNLLWRNYSGGGASAAATAEIYERLFISDEIPENWQAKV